MAERTKQEQLLDRLLEPYTELDVRLTGIIANYVNIGLDDDQIQSTWAHQKRVQVQTIARQIQQEVKKLEGLDSIAQELIVQEYLKGVGVTSVDSLIGTNKQALDQMIKQLLGDLKDARLQIVRKASDAYQTIITQTNTGVAIGGRTRIEAARRSLALFADKGITAFIDASGKQWDIRSYTEMATRTGVNNALREGRLVNLTNNGADLIIVRTSPRYCELCSPYKDKVLSISGQDTKHPSLDSAKANGLYHANCRCSFTKYSRGITNVESTEAIDNTYDEEQDLRNAERYTRKWKRRLAVATTDKDIAKAKAKIKQWRNEVTTIADDNDLVLKSNRLSNRAAR